jgi:hypothetical protein
MLKSAFLTIFLMSIFVSSTFAAPAEEKALTKKHPGNFIYFIFYVVLVILVILLIIPNVISF